MNTVQGTNIHCGIVNTATNTFTQFAFSKKATISMSREMQEISSPTSGQDKDYIPGRKGWKMTVGCLLCNDETTVWNAYDNGEKITVSWRETKGTECREFTGEAYITSIKATGNIHEMATFDIEFQGTGTLNYRQVNPIYVAVTKEVDTELSTARMTYYKYTLGLFKDAEYTTMAFAPFQVTFSITNNNSLSVVTIAKNKVMGSASVNAEDEHWPRLLSPVKSDYNFIIMENPS